MDAVNLPPANFAGGGYRTRLIQRMFELDKYDAQLHGEQASVPASNYAPEMNVEKMSLLFWGEHCVECAAPSCYQTCDLYQPRADKRCRRFAFGVYKNRNFRSMRGYGVEVSFKKWAKIEAYGNLAMEGVQSVLRYERLLELGSPLGSLAGKMMAKLTNKEIWESATYIATEKLVHRKGRIEGKRKLPDAFLLEVYNPGVETVRLQLIFGPFQEDGAGAKALITLGPTFARTVSIPSGYSRHEIEVNLLRAVLTSERPFKISMIPEADNNARLIFLTADFATFREKPAVKPENRRIKCVVWDLDNTLWKGILIEGDEVEVRPEVLQLIRHLDERGILLSVASKNDHGTAWKKLEQLGISEYFLYPQINWAPKSASIKQIAERLNIGTDTFAFVDDNPFELDQVKDTLPEVLGVNATDISSLFADARFEGSTSTEARQRRQFYREAISREQAQEEFSSNYLGFLATCEIVLEVAPYAPEDLERVAELVQRTNQLNFSGHKYTRAQLDEILANARLDKYVLKSSDKYGSYGTVGFSIVEQGLDVIQVRDFMLSCRVQGKFIEQAFFHHLVEHHNPENVKRVWVNFHETARNKPAQQVLEALGFQKNTLTSDELPGGVIHVSANELQCDFVRVQCSVDTFEGGQAVMDSAANSRTSSV
jgi:FkbH-like protein